METHKRLSKATTIQDIFDMTDEPKEIAVNDLKCLWKDGHKPKLWTPEHAERIQRCDLRFPILVITKNGQYVNLIDGHHRIVKAIQNNVSVVPVRVLNLDGLDVEEQRLVTKLVKILYWHWSNDNNYDNDHQTMIPREKDHQNHLYR